MSRAGSSACFPSTLAEASRMANQDARPHKEVHEATPLSLLERVRAHDPAAWQRLIRLYQPLVLFWCGKGGIRLQDTEDVAQEVFAAAAAGLDGFRRDRPGDTFRGWLRGITRNHILLSFRRNNGRPLAVGGSDAWLRLHDIPDSLPGPGEDDEVEMSQLYQRVLEQVREKFEERTWQAFWLTVIKGRIPATLTEELGMSVASIRQAKSRVLRHVKQELGELLG
jgi:RNA polymerase sigma-70 factor (ECF subfamily)